MTVDTGKLTEPFPQTAIKTRQGGGGKGLRYVEGHTVIHRLNAATDNQWSFRVLNIDTRQINTARGESALVMATVELEIPGLGSRQHIGVQMVNDAGGEDLVKGAITDALKKAATLFGVGLELYGPDYESGEVAAPATARQAPRPAPPLGADVRPHEPAVPAMYQPGPDEPATDKQRKRIFAKSKGLEAWKAEWSDTALRTQTQLMTGKESSTQLTVAEAEELIGYLAELERAQPQLLPAN